MSDATVKAIVDVVGLVLVLWALSGFPAFWRKDKKE